MKLPQVFSWLLKHKLNGPLTRPLSVLLGLGIIFLLAFLPFMLGQNQPNKSVVITPGPINKHTIPSTSAGATVQSTGPSGSQSEANGVPQVKSNPKTTGSSITTKSTSKPTTGATINTNSSQPKPILTLADFAQPVKGTVLRGTSKGLIWWEVLGDYRQHVGQDIAAPSGTTVQASAGGTVTELGIDPTYGHVVVITHANGWKTVYGQLSDITVKINEAVRKGQKLGQVGPPEGGEANLASHLHFEILKLDAHNTLELRN